MLLGGENGEYAGFFGAYLRVALSSKSIMLYITALVIVPSMQTPLRGHLDLTGFKTCQVWTKR